MKPASAFFTEEDRAVIAEAVAKAESGTSGEIVPVAATASGRYDRAEDIFGLVIALLSLCVAWALFQDVVPAEGDWAHGVIINLSLPVVLIIIIIGFAFGSAAASFFPILRLPFILKSEMKEEVERSAREAFQMFSVRGTRGATGILIYVSLYERMVRVVGDDAIAAKLDQEKWAEVCALAVNGMKEGKLAEGYANAIEKCGELLVEHFPIEPGDKNELANELRIID